MSARIVNLNQVDQTRRPCVLIGYCHKCNILKKIEVNYGEFDVELNNFRQHQTNGTRCLDINEYEGLYSTNDRTALSVHYYTMLPN